MNSYSDHILNISAVPYEKYAEVSSREKLIAYAICYLKECQIPTTFNNICITAFKLFPEKFYFSEDFKQFPHIEMLNRTILHLRPIERNYAAGSVRSEYKLTPLGEEIARQVKAVILSGKSDRQSVLKVKPMDSHKKTSQNDLSKILKSEIYKEWLETEQVDEMKLWKFFEVTPFTQQEKVRSFIKQTKSFAASIKENNVIKFLDYIQTQII